jgi:hypothetical protein
LAPFRQFYHTATAANSRKSDKQEAGEGGRASWERQAFWIKSQPSKASEVLFQQRQSCVSTHASVSGLDCRRGTHTSSAQPAKNSSESFKTEGHKKIYPSLKASHNAEEQGCVPYLNPPTRSRRGCPALVPCKRRLALRVVFVSRASSPLSPSPAPTHLVRAKRRGHTEEKDGGVAERASSSARERYRRPPHLWVWDQPTATA